MACTTASKRPSLRAIGENASLLQCRRLRSDLILVFKIFKGVIDLSPIDIFLPPLRPGWIAHTYRKLQGPSHLRQRGREFSVRVVEHWNRFPAFVVIRQQLDHQWSIIFPVSLCCPTYLLPGLDCNLSFSFLQKVCMLILFVDPKGKSYQ